MWKCLGNVWEVCGECVESRCEVPGKFAESVGGSFFGSGWEYGTELKHL